MHMKTFHFYFMVDVVESAHELKALKFILARSRSKVPSVTELRHGMLRNVGETPPNCEPS